MAAMSLSCSPVTPPLSLNRSPIRVYSRLLGRSTRDNPLQGGDRADTLWVPVDSRQETVLTKWNVLFDPNEGAPSPKQFGLKVEG